MISFCISCPWTLRRKHVSYKSLVFLCLQESVFWVSPMLLSFIVGLFDTVLILLFFKWMKTMSLHLILNALYHDGWFLYCVCQYTNFEMPLNTMNVRALENVHLKLCMLQVLYLDFFYWCIDWFCCAKGIIFWQYQTTKMGLAKCKTEYCQHNMLLYVCHERFAYSLP